MTNAYGDVLITSDPLGHQAARSYDANRNVVTETDPLNNTTTYNFDKADQLVEGPIADLVREAHRRFKVD